MVYAYITIFKRYFYYFSMIYTKAKSAFEMSIVVWMNVVLNLIINVSVNTKNHQNHYYLEKIFVNFMKFKKNSKNYINL